MSEKKETRQQAYLDKTTAEVEGLVARGVRMGGTAFSPVLFVKGELSDEEAAGAQPLSGADGAALKASLQALGYAPQAWETLLTVSEDGAPLEPDCLREAVCVLDPSTLVCCDEVAANAVRETYADEFSALEKLDEALFGPGIVTQICGIRMLNLGGFAAALGDAHKKQIMWARLKQIPPLGEPY